MSTVLTQTHFEQLERDSYIIVHNFLPEAQRAEMAAAIRRVLPPWAEVEDKTKTSDGTYFPYEEQCLNRAILNPEGILFAQIAPLSSSAHTANNRRGPRGYIGREVSREGE